MSTSGADGPAEAAGGTDGAAHPSDREDESAVLAALRAGDEAAFRDLVVRLTPVLTHLARSYTPTSAAAQDAVQDTWLVVLDKLDSFAGRSSLRTWICGILVHKARRSGLRERRTVPFSSAWRDERSEDRSRAVDAARFHSRSDDGTTGTWASPPFRWDHLPEDQLAADELRRVIDAAIADLPARQKEVITVRDVLGMNAAEAALVLGVTAGNQRVLLHQARSKVRAVLEQYGVDVADPTHEHDNRAAGGTSLGQPRPAGADRSRPAVPAAGEGRPSRAPGRDPQAPSRRAWLPIAPGITFFRLRQAPAALECWRS